MFQRTRTKVSRAARAASLGGGVALAAILLLAAVAVAKEMLTVVQRETAIRKEKRLLSAKVATVHEADQLEKLEEDGSWLRVSFQDQEGWIPSSAVSADRNIVLSGEAISEGVHATEQSAGARGFNPQVEAQHRASRSDLDAAYQLIDRIQAIKYPEEKIAAFVRDGKLGDAVADAGTGRKSAPGRK